MLSGRRSRCLRHGSVCSDGGSRCPNRGRVWNHVLLRERASKGSGKQRPRRAGVCPRTDGASQGCTKRARSVSLIITFSATWVCWRTASLSLHATGHMHVSNAAGLSAVQSLPDRHPVWQPEGHLGKLELVPFLATTHAREEPHGAFTTQRV